LFSCFCFEDLVDGVGYFFGRFVSVSAGEVYHPVGVPEYLEFDGVGDFGVVGGVVVGDVGADVIDFFRLDVVSGEDLAGDGRAFDFLEFSGGGAVGDAGLGDADVVEDGGGLDDGGVAAFGLVDLEGVLVHFVGVVDHGGGVGEGGFHFEDEVVVEGGVLVVLCVHVGTAYGYGYG